MKQLATLYNSELVDTKLTLETRSDKLGNIFHFVTFQDGESKDYARFKHLSSALDFISSNFK